MTCIVETHDFHKALSKIHHGIEIFDVTEITDHQVIIETNFGRFVCESFEDKVSATVYMKVYEVID